ncbi:unnamed protein product [Parajaminaea phylloscopi]
MDRPWSCEGWGRIRCWSWPVHPKPSTAGGHRNTRKTLRDASVSCFQPSFVRIPPHCSEADMSALPSLLGAAYRASWQSQTCSMTKHVGPVVQRASRLGRFRGAAYSTGTWPPPHNAGATQRLRRSLLYVPGSNEKMIRKSHSVEADTVVLDLEDSVADHRKGAAREAVLNGLQASPAKGPEMAVRINPPSGNEMVASDDLELLIPLRQLSCVVVPKVEHESDLFFILQRAQQLRSPDAPPLSLVLSIESASSLLRISSILDAVRRSSNQPLPASISSLLFASEDFCHSAGIIRTRSRRELLFPRQQMNLIAKAYGLQAIDMVCIDYKDQNYLEEECVDGHELGFDGKQAIHPAQVAAINRVFSPSEEEIYRAAKIKHAYEQAVKSHRGAVGVTIDGQTLMIDAPMLKQADSVLARAAAAGKPLPDAATLESV